MALDDQARLDALAYEYDRRAGEAFSATMAARTEPALLALCAQVDHMEADAAVVRRAAAALAEQASLRAERDAAIARAERAEVAHSTLLRASREYLAADDAWCAAVDQDGDPMEPARVAQARDRLRTVVGEG